MCKKSTSALFDEIIRDVLLHKTDEILESKYDEIMQALHDTSMDEHKKGDVVTYELTLLEALHNVAKTLNGWNMPLPMEADWYKEAMDIRLICCTSRKNE